MEGKSWISYSPNVKKANEYGKFLHWATSLNDELPISIEKSNSEAEWPLSLLDILNEALRTHSDKPALRTKIQGDWNTLTYREYYGLAEKFARGLIQLGLKERATVNILGFNSPEWILAYTGTIFANCVPIGVYTTNGPEACFHIASHSECQLVVVQNETHLEKYIEIWHKLPQLKAVIVYSPLGDLRAYEYRYLVYSWDKFLSLGSGDLSIRMSHIHPNTIATIVYTSGTTGPPKGVLLTHDNYIWSIVTLFKLYGKISDNERIVSYLPLSHVAGQCMDIVAAVWAKACVYFADEKAFAGTLGATLKDVRPTIFLSVPRVWEKIEEKIKEAASKNNFMLKQLGKWARQHGVQYTAAHVAGKPTSFSFSIANSLLFKRVKEAIGLDQCKMLIVSAAPVSKPTLEFFLSLGMPLFNCYGTSETSGLAVTFT